MSIARNFVDTAQRLPHKPFLVSSDGTAYTYADTLSRARKFAALLRSEGIGPGERVILTFPNSVDYLCSYLGTLINGCTALLVDFRSRPRHLDYVRTNSEASLWVTARPRRDFDDVPDQLVFPVDLDGWPELPMDRMVLEDNPLALIMYTSGSTGTPKGVRLSHANLQHTIRAITNWARIDGTDRELTTLSLTHLFGLAHVHIYWTLGGTVYVEEKLRDIPRLMQKISAEGITSFPGTPGGFKLILDQYADLLARHGRNLKYIIVNSAPMAPEYVRKMLDLLPDTRFYMYYGLTEASRSTYICYNDHPEKIESVGRATPGAEVCVGSPDAPLIDEPGEILIRGPHVTEGYLGIDSAPYFLDGWLRTGDAGVMDRDGFVTWKGRIKEQINIDGLKLTPTEVETVLMDHPKVRDCAVVGAPDELTGESVTAFVVAEGEPDERLEIGLRRFCQDRLEVYKIPKRILFLDSIPRTDSGKTKRMQLKESLDA